MSEIILTSAHVNFNILQNELVIPVDAVMYLERVPSRWLAQAEIASGICITAFDPTTDWANWEKGRVFCRQWELRWEGQQAIYTGEASELSGFITGPDLSHNLRQEKSYYLWGKRDNDRFIELQVARVLSYPVVTGTRVTLHVIEWFNGTGELVASRFTGLEEAL